MIPDVSGADTDWRWADPSGQQRLVRTDELRAALASGLIAPNTPVWRSGWKEWRPAQDVAELMTSALSAANGVVPNIPPPPLAMVAVQRAYEGLPDADANKKQSEPPPPPTYIPAPTRPQPGVFHTPSQAMRVQPVPRAPSSTPKLAPTPKPPTSTPKLAPTPQPSPAKENGPSPDGSVGLAALEAHIASKMMARASKGSEPPSTARPTGDDPDAHERQTVPSDVPHAVRATPAPPPIALSSLVRSQPPPPPVSRKTSKPPPPKPMSKPPPPVRNAGPEIIEELSGSVLLTDGTGSQNAIIDELSGSMLMPDLSGPQLVVPMGKPGDELSGSFLLDAGSTGALPSVESTGQILAAKAASRAPFAADSIPDQTGTVPKVIVPFDDPSDLAATVIKPPPSVVVSAPVPVGVASPFVPPPNAEPFMVSPPYIAPEQPAKTTMIGVPPPPELAALQAAANAPMIPQPSPSSARLSDPLPQPERSTARLHDFRAIVPDPRAKFLVPGLALLGALVLLGVIGLVIGLVRKKPSEEAPPVTPTTASASSTATSAPTATATAAPPPAASALGSACTLGGVAHVIAPRAVVQSGVEADIVNGRLAIGFATRDRDGIAVEVDPSTLAATKTARAHTHSPDVIRRLVPVIAGSGIAAAADVERAGDSLAGRRTVAASSPFDLGFGGGGLAWAPHRSSEVDLIWALDGDAPVEAVRAAALDPSHDDAGWVIAFRRGTSIYAGAVNGGATLTPKGPLVKVDGLGPQIGSPTIAAQDGAVLVAWADRAQASAPWALRWMRFTPGEASAEAKSFVPSEGGLGEHAMSPAIAAAGQGRFVLVWTEGPVSNHQVRAQTISGSGAPIGTAMAISDSGVNAGQAQLAILPDGHGIVASLASSGAGPKAAYEVLATPIVCP
jgi:hypothetical protein